MGALRKASVLLWIGLACHVWGAGLPACGAAAVTIRLRPEVALRRGIVRLGQIADVSSFDRALAQKLNGLPLGYTPWPGSLRKITRQPVALALKRSGLSEEEVEWRGGACTQVSLLTVVVPGNRIVEVAHAYLAELARLKGGEVQIRALATPRDRRIPAGVSPPVLDVVPMTFGMSGAQVRPLVRISVDRTPVTVVPVPFSVRRFQRIAVMKKRARRGDTLGAAHVTLRRIELTPAIITRGPVTDIGGVLGSRARRTLASGEILSAHDVLPALAVRADEMVKVVVKVRNVLVEAQAVARRDGQKGDVIPVELKRGTRRTILQCRVIGEGVVQVTL